MQRLVHPMSEFDAANGLAACSFSIVFKRSESKISAFSAYGQVTCHSLPQAIIFIVVTTYKYSWTFDIISLLFGINNPIANKSH